MQSFVSHLGFTFFFPDEYVPVSRPLQWRSSVNKAGRGESYWAKRAIKSASLLLDARAADKSVLRLAEMPLKRLGVNPEPAELERAVVQILGASKEWITSNESTQSFRLDEEFFVLKTLDRAPKKNPDLVRHVAFLWMIFGTDLVVWFSSSRSAQPLSVLRESRIRFGNGVTLPLLGDC
jgi:hypothetical protein